MSHLPLLSPVSGRRFLFSDPLRHLVHLSFLVVLTALGQEPGPAPSAAVSSPDASSPPKVLVSPAPAAISSTQAGSNPSQPGQPPQIPAPPPPPPDQGVPPAQPVTPTPPAPPALTAQDFLRLWNETKLEDRVLRQRPPVEGVIRSATYTATLTGQPAAPTSMTVQATLQLQSFQKGWSVVPLSSQPLPVVKSETGNAFLTVKDQGYILLLPDEGTYQIQLSMTFPVDSVEGTPTAEIKLPHSPVSTFSGSLSGSGWSIKTTRNLLPVNVHAEGADTAFSLSPGAVTTFQLQWERPQDNKANEPVIFAESEIRSHIRPDAVKSDLKISLELPRAPVGSVRVSISSEHEVVSVAGDGVKTWKLEKEPKSQSLEVWFSTPRKNHCELTLALEQTVPQLPFSATLPVIRVERAFQEGGSIQIFEEQDVTTVLDALQNLARQASNFHPAPHQRDLGCYRFLRSEYGATLKMTETTPQISASADTLFHIDESYCSFSTALRLDVQGRSVLQSVVVPPAGFVVDKVSGEAVRSFEIKGSRLTVSFRTPQLGVVQLELTGKKPRREGVVEEQELPHFTIENALEYNGRIRLDFPPSIQVDVRNETSPMALRPSPKSFEYLNTPPTSPLVVTRKAPQVEVASTEELSFKHHETTIHCLLKYQIRNRFPDRLLLRIPTSLANSVEFRSSTLRIIDRNASPATTAAARSDDESLYTYWALHDPDKTLGEHQVELTITEKLPDPLYNQPLITPSLLVVPLQVERLEGKITTSLDENVVLKPVTETGVRVLTGEPANPGHGPSFEYSSSDSDLTFAVTRLRYVELPSLAVDLAEVTHVVSGDGSISTEIACRVIVDQPADLEIQLPQGARMNSQVFCNETPIAPRQTTEQNLVAVTLRPEKKTAGSNETIVRFTYDVPSIQASKSLGSRGDLPIPVAMFRNARTLDSHTTIYLPPTYRYFGFVTPMTLESGIPGWTKAKQHLTKLLPSLASWTNSGNGVAEPPPAISSIPAFDYRIPLRKEGQKFSFTYSAAPDTIAVSYLSQRYATLLEAGAFFLALFLGILITRQALEAKVVFLIFAGVLSLIASSFAPPHMAAIYQAVCLGAVASIGFWFLAGLISLFRGLSANAPAEALPDSFPPPSQPLGPKPEPPAESPFVEHRQPAPDPANPEIGTPAAPSEEEKIETVEEKLASPDGEDSKASPPSPDPAPAQSGPSPELRP